MKRSIDSTIQRSIDPSIQRFNDPSIQRFNDPSIQRFNDPSIQRSNDPSIQRFNELSERVALQQDIESFCGRDYARCKLQLSHGVHVRSRLGCSRLLPPSSSSSPVCPCCPPLPLPSPPLCPALCCSPSPLRPTWCRKLAVGQRKKCSDSPRLACYSCYSCTAGGDLALAEAAGGRWPQC